MTKGIRRSWLSQIVKIDPIAILDNGFPVYPIQGAEPKKGEDGEEEEEEEEEDDDSGNGSKGGADGDDDSNGNSDSNGNAKSKDEQIAELARENRWRRKETRKAEDAKKAAETKIKEYEDKDKSELDKAKSDLEVANKRAEELAKANEQAALERSFLRNDKYKWHNPETALKLVDMSDVTVGDDGKVEGMKEAVDALAKEHPYLLKRDEDEEEDEGRPSGAAFGKNKKDDKGQGKQADREALLKKYPTLTRM